MRTCDLRLAADAIGSIRCAKRNTIGAAVKYRWMMDGTTLDRLSRVPEPCLVQCQYHTVEDRRVEQFARQHAGKGQISAGENLCQRNGSEEQ